MALTQIPLPNPLNSKKPEEWRQWIARFECYRIASALDKKDESVQANTLVYAMGGNSLDILTSFKLADDELKYEIVKKKFEKHFEGRTNTIFERARFNRRVQGETESVIDFIEDLYKFSETCNFGELKDQLIRDRIVVGIKDSTLARKLMQDEGLTLEKAANAAKAAEMVQNHQKILKGEVEEAKIGAVEQRKKTRTDNMAPNEKKPQDQKSHKECYNCGKSPLHKREDCPAKQAKCHKCQKIGHFARVCKSKSVNHVENENEFRNEAFLGSVRSESNSDKWKINLLLNKELVNFKIDTGADVTVIPDSLYSSNKHWGTLRSVNKALFGPGQAKLAVRGMLNSELSKDDKTTMQDIYVVKGLKEPLVGKPAIEALNLVVKVENISDYSNSVTERVKTKFSNLFEGLGELKGEFKIALKPDAKPFAISTPRRVPLPLYGKVKNELQRMEDLGVISKVDEPTDWCAGIVVVPKKDGGVRICVDLTKLNENVLRETHPLPKIDHLLAQLGESKLFSKLDANSGFWQEKLSPESRLLTTFITPFGRFYFNRMPFGVKSAPEHYEKKMTNELEGLEGVISIMDDILIHAKTKEEHDQRLDAALHKLSEAGVTLNEDKCEFGKTSIRFAGHIISDKGVLSDPEKTEAIRQMEAPTNVSEVRRFLGMVNQLGKFIPHLADKTRPLRELLVKKNSWNWNIAQQTAFDKLKDELISTPVLAHYDPAKATTVSADASSYGIGAVLRQEHNGEMKPVAYASRSMTSTEQRYAQIEKEALATTWACEKFSDYLVGKDFEIETDHKPLVSLLGSKNLDELPPRIQRFRMRLMRYSYTIVHIPGKNIITADALSRAPLKTVPSEAEIEFTEDTHIYVSSVINGLPASEKRLEEIRQRQEDDEVCIKLREYCLQEDWPAKPKLHSSLQAYWPYRGEITVQHGLLMMGSRLIIPSSMRLDILDKIHSGHQGIRKCRERAKDSVWWPGLSKQIEDMVTTCTICCKERKNRAEPMIESNFPERPWQKVASDLFHWRGTEYIIAVDYFSRFFEMSPLKITDSEAIVSHLKSFFARHGIPETFITDNGPQYISDIFRKFSVEWGFTHITSSPRFPQSNGEIERAVQTAKNLLKKSDEDPYLSLLSYRTTPLHNGYSPSELLMGRKLRTTLPVVPDKLKPVWPDLTEIERKEREYKQKQAGDFNKHHNAKPLSQLTPGEKVWLSDKRTPGTVVRKADEPRSYIVQTDKSILRRNRRHLVPDPQHESNATSDQTSNQEVFIPDTKISDQENQPDLTTELPTSPVDSQQYSTRSGRLIVKPNRLDL